MELTNGDSDEEATKQHAEVYIGIQGFVEIQQQKDLGDKKIQ